MGRPTQTNRSMQFNRVVHKSHVHGNLAHRRRLGLIHGGHKHVERAKLILGRCKQDS